MSYKNNTYKSGLLTNIDGIPIYYHYKNNFPKNKTLYAHAKANRKAGNLSEVLFWMQVHSDVFYNIDFDRQIVIGNYIVDFYIKSLGLIIEIKKMNTAKNETFNTQAESFFSECGLQIFRIDETDILFNLQHVMENLKQFITLHYSKPSKSKLLQKKYIAA